MTKVYGGDGVDFTPNAKKQIKLLEDWGLDKLPICVAKTQYSLSDNPALLGGTQGVPDHCPGCPCFQWGLASLSARQAISWSCQACRRSRLLSIWTSMHQARFRVSSKITVGNEESRYGIKENDGGGIRPGNEFFFSRTGRRQHCCPECGFCCSPHRKWSLI